MKHAGSNSSRVSFVHKLGKLKSRTPFGRSFVDQSSVTMANFMRTNSSTATEVKPFTVEPEAEPANL